MASCQRMAGLGLAEGKKKESMDGDDTIEYYAMLFT